MLKRQRQKPDHRHYVITCGVQECLMSFPLCGAGGLPCFVICPYCQTVNSLGRVSDHG